MEGILVSVTTGAMTSLLSKLATMMSEKYQLLKDVRKDIKFLSDELEAMHAFLLCMADVEEPDELTKHRVRVVRDLSYDIEDSIDRFMVLVHCREPCSKKRRRGLKKLIVDKSKNFVNDIKARYQIAGELTDIKAQVIGVSERYARYKIEEYSSHMQRNIFIDPRVIAIFRDASELVGIDGPRDELVKWLNVQGEPSSRQLKVVSIVGFGGLGKTTLARQVYETVRASFDCYAFLSISRHPDMTKVLDSVLSQIRNKESSKIGAGDQQLTIGKIREFLTDKRYFIVVDDIWDVPTWRILERAFVKNYGSIIMTTTRINDVANSCCSSHENLLYQIKPLNAADSKKLFFKRIFGSEERCPSNLREASEEILQRCGGLPLAITAVSSFLATRQSEDQWDIVRKSICFPCDRNSEVYGIRRILSLSYFDLTHCLRSCLLYLTLFLEDSVIKRDSLVHRWIAEGFIHAEAGQDLVEVGQTCFYELINRSLIQPVEIGFDGKAQACRVHDTIHDFLTRKSREDNFCYFVRNHSINHKDLPVDKVRWLSIMANNEGDLNISPKLNISQIRTLGVLRAKRLPSLSNFSALRVLSLSGCYELGNHDVANIGSLLQLRYLDISGTGISELPNEIGSLQYLWLLNTASSCLYKLPETCTQLKRLARLFVFSGTKVPDGIGKIKSLQEIEWINVFQYSLDFLQELGELTDLRKLSIIWRTADINGDKEIYKKKLVTSLCKLDGRRLHTLRIHIYLREDEDLAGDRFCPPLNCIREIFLHSASNCRISTWLVSLINIKYLDITVKDIERQDLELIGNIPNLLEFRMSLIGSKHRESIIICTGFQQLQKFRFDSLTPGKSFVVEAGAMPLLKSLELRIQLAPFELSDIFEQTFELAVGDFEFGIQHLSCLAIFSLEMNYDRTWSTAYVEAVVGAFMSMVETHPNNPSLEITSMFHEQDDETATNNRVFPVEVPHLHISRR